MTTHGISQTDVNDSHIMTIQNDTNRRKDFPKRVRFFHRHYEIDHFGKESSYQYYKFIGSIDNLMFARLVALGIPFSSAISLLCKLIFDICRCIDAIVSSITSDESSIESKQTIVIDIKQYGRLLFGVLFGAIIGICSPSFAIQCFAPNPVDEDNGDHILKLLNFSYGKAKKTIQETTALRYKEATYTVLRVIDDIVELNNNIDEMKVVAAEMLYEIVATVENVAYEIDVVHQSLDEDNGYIPQPVTSEDVKKQVEYLIAVWSAGTFIYSLYNKGDIHVLSAKNIVDFATNLSKVTGYSPNISDKVKQFAKYSVQCEKDFGMFKKYGVTQNSFIKEYNRAAKNMNSIFKICDKGADFCKKAAPNFV